jgi:hypothetical protein
MNISKIFISAIVLLLSSSVFAQTQVPNTFQSGQPARASEVNENFSELETAVNQNASDVTSNAAVIAANTNAIQGTGIPRVLDGGDNLIGYLVNIEDSNQSIDVLTEQGYIRSGLAFSNGQEPFPGTVWFSGGNCTGTAYTDMPNGFVRVLYDETGVEKLYYADKNSAAQVSPTILSLTGNAGCSAYCCAISRAWPVLPNDPVITGFSNQTSYTVPIKIEYTP